jgi:hypothetical protein
MKKKSAAGEIFVTLVLFMVAYMGGRLTFPFATEYDHWLHERISALVWLCGAIALGWWSWEAEQKLPMILGVAFISAFFYVGGILLGRVIMWFLTAAPGL